jgi:hypothetical protein
MWSRDGTCGSVGGGAEAAARYEAGAGVPRQFVAGVPSAHTERHRHGVGAGGVALAAARVVAGAVGGAASPRGRAAPDAGDVQPHGVGRVRDSEQGVRGPGIVVHCPQGRSMLSSSVVVIIIITNPPTHSLTTTHPPPPS